MSTPLISTNDNGFTPPKQDAARNASESKAKLIVDLYNKLSSEEQEKFMKIATEVVGVQEQAIGILMETLLKIQKKTKEQDEIFQKFQEYLSTIQTKPITQADIEESKRGLEEIDRALEKAKRETEKAKRETEEAKLETIKNRSFLLIAWMGLKKIGEQFKEKAFKGFYVSGKDANNPQSSPGGSTRDNHYTYLSPKSLALGGVLLTGGFFFLQNGSERVRSVVLKTAIGHWHRILETPLVRRR